MCETIWAWIIAHVSEAWAKTIGGFIMWLTDLKNKRLEGEKTKEEIIKIKKETKKIEIETNLISIQEVRTQVRSIMLQIIRELKEAAPKSPGSITIVNPKTFKSQIKIEFDEKDKHNNIDFICECYEELKREGIIKNYGEDYV